MPIDDGYDWSIESNELSRIPDAEIELSEPNTPEEISAAATLREQMTSVLLVTSDGIIENSPKQQSVDDVSTIS